LELYNVVSSTLYSGNLSGEKFYSTDKFGYLPNFNKYTFSDLCGDIINYNYIDKEIINKVERIISNTSKK